MGKRKSTKRIGNRMGKADIPNTATYFLRQEFWARNIREVEVRLFLVLFFRRI